MDNPALWAQYLAGLTPAEHRFWMVQGDDRRALSASGG
jgi:hypothetical protein